MGSPDISCINRLAEVLNVNVTEILSGDRSLSINNRGNMKKTQFYACPVCGNIIAGTNPLLLNCCGKKLTVLKVNQIKIEETECDGKDKISGHEPVIEYVEDDICISIKHDMNKEHFISFIAYVTTDKVMMTKLYPEQNAQVRFKMSGHGMIYVFCNKDGLWVKLI